MRAPRFCLYLALLHLLPLALRAQIPGGPLFWFRADSGVVRRGDTVVRWRDISGHGYDALPTSDAARPLYTPGGPNGRPAVAIPGGGQFLRCADHFPIASSYTKVVVARFASFTASNNILSSMSGHAFWLGGTRSLKLWHAGDFADSYVPCADGANILIGTFDQSTLRGVVYVNGAFGAAGFAAAGNSDSTLLIGAHAGGYGMSGEVAEILVYNRVLSEGERDALERYLAARYGVALAAEHRPFPFSHFPQPLALYARDEHDSAAVPIAGAVTFGAYDSVRVDCYRDGGYWRSLAQVLHYAAGGAPFHLEPKIYARRVEFGFRVYLVRNGTDTLIGARDSIICGDVLYINGQSNSCPGNGAVTFANEFCRTFGVHTGYGTYEPSDTIWGLASASNGAFQGRWHVGIWGLRLQQLILERQGIPTCAVTAGVSGSRIEWNLRSDAAPEDPTTIYGRGLFRMRHAHLADKVRMIFWYQGESNGIDGYYANFRTLYNSWRSDYPALEHFYVVQIRPGCAADTTHYLVRDLLRTLGDSLPAVTTYAPTAAPGHDGCHYAPEGYYTIAAQLYNLVARDFYGSDDTVEIRSPNIERAYYSTPAHDEITLRFQAGQHMIWPHDSVIAGALRPMIDQFLLDGTSGRIDSGYAAGNTIRLHLRAPSNAARITYVPPLYYEGTTTIYEGPWLVNRRGVGAFTFANIPIEASASGVRRDARVDAPDAEIVAIIPNPFAAGAGIHIRLGARADVTIDLVDALGRVVGTDRRGMLDAGEHVLDLHAAGLPSGTYRCVVHVGSRTVQAPVVVAR